MQIYIPPNVRKAVVNKLEFLLRVTLNKCVSAGALLTDIIYLYLFANGMDFYFCFNTSGAHTTTLETILLPNGLHIILDQFAAMIQSGKNIFIDENTRLHIYAFTPPSGGTGHLHYSDKEVFLKKKCRTFCC